MSILRNRKLMALAVALGTGTVFQYVPTGCGQYGAALGASAFNWCSVFNCTGGGYFNFCSPNPVFVDCPNTPTTTTP
jgi:hypothetical protein